MIVIGLLQLGALWLRLLRQRRGVEDYYTDAAGAGEEMTVGAEGDTVAPALDCFEREELVAGFGIPGLAAAGHRRREKNLELRQPTLPIEG